MLKRIATAAAVSLVLAGVLAAGANAVAIFTTKVSSGTAKPGQTIKASGKGALKNTKYYCVIAVYSYRSGKAISGPDQSTLKTVRSDSKGKIKCSVKYQPFKAKAGGKTRSCPLSKADKKEHFRCGVAFADKATAGAKSASVAPFTATK